MLLLLFWLYTKMKVVMKGLDLIFVLLCIHFRFIKSEFYQNEDDVSNFNGAYCRQKWSCVVPDIDDRNCKCDSLCTLYNDCCTDVKTTLAVKTITPKFKCEYIPEIEQESFVFVVHICPRGTGRDLVRACEETITADSLLPVSGKITGCLYRNMFCAACHQEDFHVWQGGFSCNWKYVNSVNKTLESMQNDKDCSKLYYPPQIASEDHVSKTTFEARTCFPVIDTCNSTEHATQCEDGKTALVFGEDVFKNIDCALCNNVDIENVTCSARTWKLRPTGVKRDMKTYSYRLLFDFNTNEATGTFTKRSKVQSEDKNKQLCPNYQVYDPFTDICRKVNCILPLVYENGKCIFNSRNSSVRIFPIGNKDDKTAKDVERKNCVYLKLNDTEYNIIDETKIFIFSLNKTMSNGLFYRDGNNTYVCETELRSTARERLSGRKYSEAESTLSLVGSILSITALTITLILYLRFPKLWNTPGKSLICLMFTLIIAQLLFLLASSVEDKKHVCTGFAVLIHYAFLASVFWMNCLSFDIFITFSKGFVKSDNEDARKTFLWYSLYAWLCPLLIVVSGLCLDALTDDDYRPMYGEIVCWIGNKRAILVYFLIPIGLVVVSNLFFYLFTVRSIFLSSRQTSRILRRKKSCKVFVYIKLSIVMGLTWVFAYIASFSNEPVFWYLFIFFNSWQGVFIFISFVCFGKVRTHVLDRVRVVSSYFQSRTITSTLTDSTKRQESIHN